MEVYVLKRRTVQGVSYYRENGFTILLNFAKIFYHIELAKMKASALGNVEVQPVNLDIKEKSA